MIKIIKRGTREIQECSQCGCLFSYEQEDIKKDINDNFKMGLSHYSKKYIICPQCKNEVTLEVIR